jgi:thioredoxin reductase (NADPH)
MRDLVAAGKMQLLQGNAIGLQKDGERLTGLEVQTADGQMRTIAVDHVFAFFGLHPKLGPIAEWGL